MPTANVAVECYGAGGDTGTSTLGGVAGAGGGAYAKKNAFSASDATGYTVTVGAGSGQDSWFSTSGTVLAKGGSNTGNNDLVGGLGGLAISCIGDTVYGGGNGGNGTGGSNGSPSGSGGGGAGSTGAGGNGSTGGSPGTGTSVGGGNGGVSNTANNSNGSAGNTYGGGSGGASRNSGTRSGGPGAAGAVIITAPTGTITSATGGTFTQAGGNDIWTFTASGTWTPTIPAAAATNGGFLINFL